MPDRDPALAAFDVLVGTWDTEGKHRLLEEVVYGTTTFEWLEGGHFLIQRSHVDDERFPEAITIIGPPAEGDGLVAEWFDSRGIRRTMTTTVEDGVWRMEREEPGFDQRSTARLGQDSFEVLAELAETPGDWVEDMKVTFRRRVPE
jgi:hypothetical protein